jgi:hypothetical protein
VYLRTRRLSGVQAGSLDPARDHLDELAPEAVPQGRGAGDRVVLRAPVLDAAVLVKQRIRRASVAVERDADAAGVHEHDSIGTLALERQVGVPEHDHALAHGAHQLVLVRRRLGQEAEHV